MIDKIFPRLLSSAKDARIQSSEEMMDALNVNVSDGFGGDFVNDNTSESEGSGDAGVIKPALGNIDARPPTRYIFNASGKQKDYRECI